MVYIGVDIPKYRLRCLKIGFMKKNTFIRESSPIKVIDSDRLHSKIGLITVDCVAIGGSGFLCWTYTIESIPPFSC